MQGYPQLVYGIRLIEAHQALSECYDKEEAAQLLHIPDEFAVQELEEDYQYNEGAPIIYIKESEKDSPFDSLNGHKFKSIRAPETKPEWCQKLLDLAKNLDLKIEADPTWYAFVISY